MSRPECWPILRALRSPRTPGCRECHVIIGRYSSPWSWHFEGLRTSYTEETTKDAALRWICDCHASVAMNYCSWRGIEICLSGTPPRIHSRIFWMNEDVRWRRWFIFLFLFFDIIMWVTTSMIEQSMMQKQQNIETTSNLLIPKKRSKSPTGCN